MTPLIIIFAVLCVFGLGYFILPKLGEKAHTIIAIITIVLSIIAVPLFYLVIGDSFYV